MTKLIAVSHPGKLGDALHSWPTARALAAYHDCRVDFLTSDYCRPLERLCRYQAWCNDFIVPPDYVLESLGCGGQPWQMPVPDGKYAAVYHCGFRRPPNGPLHTFIRDEVAPGLRLDDVQYEFPELPEGTVQKYPYICMAPRGRTSFWPTLAEFARRSKIAVVEIGGHTDAVGGEHSIDMTGTDCLETVSILSHAHAFVGLFSSQLVLAEGFNIARVAVHDGIHWSTDAGVQSAYNVYDIPQPTVDRLLEVTQFLSPPSRCYHPWHLRQLLAEAASVDEIAGHLNGTYFGFHPGRRWEYGLAMQCMKRVNAKTVLDVGGAASILPCLAAITPIPRNRSVRLGAEVRIVDPCGPGEFQPWVKEQERRIGRPLNLAVCDFMDYSGPPADAVCCISVIEHVPNDVPFFRKLLDYVKVGGLLILTTDFLPTGEQRTTGHLRTYNAERLTMLMNIAKEQGFEPFDGEPDWTYHGNFVDSYTFSSLVLQRIR